MMTTRASILTALVIGAGAGAACAPPPFSYTKLARPAPLNEDTSVDIEPSNPDRRAASRLVKLPGEGSLTILVEPVNQTAKLDVRVYPPAGRLPVAQGSSPLEIPQLGAGDYYVVVVSMNSVATRTKIRADFKPKDFDAQSGEDGKADGALAIEPGTSVRDTVDALAMDRTDWYVVKVTEGGALTVRFKPGTTRGKVAAELQPPKGDPVLVDVRNGFENKEAMKGDWLVKVAADESGAGSYTLDVTFEAGDPEANSGDDATTDGSGEIAIKMRPGSPNWTGSVKDEVSFDKRDRSDFWKVDLPEKGKLSVVLKPKDRASRVRAEFVKSAEDDEGERIRSGFNVPVEKQVYWVKVFAPDKGDATGYTLEVEFFPDVFIEATVVEIDRRSGCALMVNKGTNQQVRAGVTANVMQGDQIAAAGVVEQAFQVLSRIKVFGADCRFSAGTVVKIQGGY